MCCLIIVTLLIVLLHTTSSAVSKCNSFKTCGSCIAFAEENCVWCSREDIDMEYRCASKKNIDIAVWCDSSFISEAKAIEITKNESKAFKSNTNDTDYIQLKPQALAYKNVRPGVPVQFTLQFKAAENYPLDVYYVMDMTYSMREHFQKLQQQGENIYKALVRKTNNVYLGFGSFVDKPAFPIANIKLHKAYTFKNHLSLSKNISQFQNGMGSLKYENQSNYDDPEAILEALMQTMVCHEMIKWRNGSRRIIVASTESSYKIAGEGRIVGAVKPNDMRCHLNNSHLELEQDYPSLSQINKVASEKTFSIIFCVLESQKLIYEPVIEHINEAIYSDLNKKDLADQIISAYEKMVGKLTINPTHSNNVIVTLDPACDKKNNSDCAVRNNEILSINVTMLVKSCSANKDDKETVKILLGGLSEVLEVELNLLCHCDCEKSDNVTKSERCNNNGVHQCGVCKCDEKRYGKTCDCFGDDVETGDSVKCKMSADDILPCNGRGNCMCGECLCNFGFSGSHCEYDNSNCPPFGGEICSGRGTCIEEKCVCDKEWKNSDCSCPVSNSTCIASLSDKVCSGNGECVCGECVCYKNSSDDKRDYSGAFCDVCDECVTQRCEELRPYIVCNYEQNQTVCDDRFNQTADIEFVNRTEINTKYKHLKECNATLSGDGGVVVFKYDYKNSTLHLIIQRERNLPAPLNIWIPIGATVGSILLIGLVTLVVWKILVDMHDTKEYKKFEKKMLDEGFNTTYYNACYKNPSTNISNPVYNRDAFTK